MPIYVYEPTIYSEDEQVHECCSFEALQSMSELPLAHCPACGHAVHRAVTSFHVKEVSFDKKSRPHGSLATQHVCGGGCRH